MNGRNHVSRAFLLALALLAAACSDGDGGADPAGRSGADRTAPSTDAPMAGDTAEGDGARDRIGVDGVERWPKVDPVEAGIDPTVLDTMADDAERFDSNCLLVARDGRIVDERYWGDGAPDRPQEVFSVTKSLASVVVGIAADDGAVDLDDPASNWVEEWQDTPSATVTIRDLLGNVSGREWSFALDYGEMATAPDHTGFAVALGQDAEPGTVWAYNNSAIQTLDRVVTEATDDTFAALGRDRLLGPLGMDDSDWTIDRSGNTLTFMGLRSTCRDLARFGVLVLAEGRWNGEEIVSSEFLREATSVSQDLNAAYGFLFWLNRRGPQASVISPLTASEVAGVDDGQMAPDRPEQLVWALGLGGQVLQMDPATNTVVVRLGGLGEGALLGSYGPEQSSVLLDGIEADGSGVGGGR